MFTALGCTGRALPWHVVACPSHQGSEDVVLTHVQVGWVPCRIEATLLHLQDPACVSASFLVGHVETWGIEDFIFF